MGYRLDNCFPFAAEARVFGALTPGLKRSGRVADRSFPPSAELKNASQHEGVLGEWRYSSTQFFISALDGSEWSVSRPERFTSRERAPGTHWIGGWGGGQSHSGRVCEEKITHPPAGNRIPVVRGCIQKFQDWPPGARTENGKPLCH
jgi:hypothetical protein